MATERNFRKKIKTPFGIAEFPWLNKPDTKFGGEAYKVTIRIKGDEATKFYNEMLEMAGVALAQQKKADPDNYKKVKSLGKLFIEPAEDEDGDVLADEYLVKAKTNRFYQYNGEEYENTINIVDMDKQEVTQSVYSGSELRAIVTIKPYSGFGGGLSAQINAVQVRNLVTGGGGDDLDFDDGFGEVEAQAEGDADDDDF